MNTLFQNALKRVPQPVPPIWMMRQAGRYHNHYQKLRLKHSFMELCKIPELAAEVAFGPVDDFDFDAAILFSDILFPLEMLGLGLEFGDGGPKLGWQLTRDRLKDLRSTPEALEGLAFQGEALKATRQRLPQHKSIIGFVGGPWTLFSYAVQGRHDGALLETKKQLSLFEDFCEHLIPLLIANIDLQLKSGAEIVMVFDTAAGEISPELYLRLVEPQLRKIFARFPSKIGYYTKGTQRAFFDHETFQQESLLGMGVDHRWTLPEVFRWRKHGFVQGNFDQALLHMPAKEFESELKSYLAPLKNLSLEARAGWICGLGHGVLPKTPEENVRRFVSLVRETLS